MVKIVLPPLFAVSLVQDNLRALLMFHLLSAPEWSCLITGRTVGGLHRSFCFLSHWCLDSGSKRDESQVNICQNMVIILTWFMHRNYGFCICIDSALTRRGMLQVSLVNTSTYSFVRVHFSVPSTWILTQISYHVSSLTHHTWLGFCSLLASGFFQSSFF